MTVIRIPGLSAAEAETIIAKVWQLLETKGIASPRIIVEEMAGLLDLDLQFDAERDVFVIASALAALRHGARARQHPRRPWPSPACIRVIVQPRDNNARFPSNEGIRPRERRLSERRVARTDHRRHV